MYRSFSLALVSLGLVSSLTVPEELWLPKCTWDNPQNLGLWDEGCLPVADRLTTE